MLLIAVAAIPVLIWIYLLTARGGFWLVSRHFVPDAIQAAPAKRVVAVIPARNEAAVIGQALESLFAQELPGPLHIVVVDDGSSDGTAEVARRSAKKIDKAAALTIVDGEPLQPGWTGKLWALSQGVTRGELLAPDYFLFTDADIRHGPEAVSELLAMAEARHYDLASYMVKLACGSTAEKALIPAFVFFFLKLYPPSWIASERSKTAGAAGGCILIRADALNKIGGIARIKNEVIDDCALARAVKGSGGRIWMGLTRGEREHSLLWKFQRNWQHDLAHRVQSTATFLSASRRRDIRTFSDVSARTAFALHRQDNSHEPWCCGMASYEHLLLAHDALLSPLSCVEHCATADCAVLPVRHDSLRYSVLAREGWRVEGEISGCPRLRSR